MKKQNLILAFILSTITFSAFAVTSNAQEQGAKSIAWYTANVREARDQNKMCFDSPQLQTSQNCKNALHALKLIYVGVGN